MMERAVEMLVAQGHSGNRSKIMMVGDRFDTDVRGGLSAELRTCLIETGCHTAAYQRFYRADPACYSAPSIADLIPHAQRLQIQLEELELNGHVVSPVADATADDGASAKVASAKAASHVAGDAAGNVAGDAVADDAVANDAVASGVASQQATAGPEGSPPTSPPCSPPAEQLLAEWVLAQGNLLRPGHCELRPRLENYFAAVSAEGVERRPPPC